MRGRTSLLSTCQTAPTTGQPYPVATGKLALAVCAIAWAIAWIVGSVSIAAPLFTSSNEQSWPALSRDQWRPNGEEQVRERRSAELSFTQFHRGAPAPNLQEAIRVTDQALAAPSTGRESHRGAVRVAEQETVSTHTLGDIYLDEQRSVIAGEPAKLLAASVGVLEEQEPWTLHLEAYCDDRDTEAYSLLVGERRLRAIHEYLSSMGVRPTRITTISFGMANPRCEEFTVSCWEEDLRVQQTFRTVAISGPQHGCLVRLKLSASRKVLRNQAQFPRPPFLQRIHLAEPLR